MISSSIIHRMKSDQCKVVMMVKADPENDELMSLSISGAHFVISKEDAHVLTAMIGTVAGIHKLVAIQ